MRLEHRFAVPVPIEQAWELFTSPERVVPCMPGAELDEDLGEGRFRGRARVRLGPVSLAFAGEAEFVELDEAAHTARLRATGRDQRGRGSAQALITSRLAGSDGSTDVVLTTDLQLSGAVAQFGRQGVVSDVSAGLVDQFAGCLRAQLAGTPQEATAATERAGRGVAVVSLVLAALQRLLRRLRDRAVAAARRRRTRGRR